jgi:iduronate 2-sulfatase
MKSLAITIGLLFCSTLGTLHASEPKNVLVIFMDDLRPELGCYGETHIQSPNIDALASQGVLFERAYCQQGICAPSRASMMAGQYPDSLGIYDLWSPLRRTVPDVVSMPRYFQERGYQTASFGKVYHHHTDDQQYWSELPNVPGEKYADAKLMQRIKDQTREARSRGLTGVDLFKAVKGPAVENADVADDAYRDGAVANQAIEALRRIGDQPFFMCVGFAKPHLPFAAPRRYWDLYKREQFEVPKRQLPDQTPKLAITKWGELRSYEGIPASGLLSDEQTRELIHGYAASVSYSDAQVGKVLDELEQLAIRDNTIVVLWGDHGYKLGDYGLWCKHTNLELDTRVPFMVSVPGFEQGKRSAALVEMVDIFPTLAELTGGGVPEDCDGKSFVRILKNPSQSFREFSLSQYPRGNTMGYSIRMDQWRFTQWVDRDSGKIVATELYDHSGSSLAEKNLANDPEHQATVGKLSETLAARQRVRAISQ